MFAQVIDGEADLADIMFLVAFVLFVIAAVTRAMVRNVDGVLIAAGAAAIALGALVL